MANKGQKSARIDLNTADVDTLRRIDGISETRARRILERRERYGPFRGWEELEAVPGIGPALMEKVRLAAFLGVVADGAVGRQVPGSMLVAGMPAEDEDTVDAIEVLTSLANLDQEAALAYEAGAEAASDLKDLRKHLLRFRDDHLRHVRDLNRLLEEFGGRAVAPRMRPEEALLRRLARLAAPFGPGALVLTLLTDEQMTNGTYELALGLDWDDDVTRLLERTAADEQRHLLWLADQEDRVSRYEGGVLSPS